jgi:FtsH-binding integral membrane protein
MTFGFTECASLAAWIAFIFMPVQRHHQKKNESMLHMFAWKMLFLIMGALLVVTAYYFTQETPADTWQLILGFVVFVVHVLVGKMYWSMKHRMDTKYRTTYFVLYMVVMLVTAILFYVALCVDGQGLYLVAVGCFSAYVALFIVKSIYKHVSRQKQDKEVYSTLSNTNIMRSTPLLPLRK